MLWLTWKFLPGGEGTYCDDEDVRRSLAACQVGRPGQPEPHALVSMSSDEGTVLGVSQPNAGN